VKRLKKLEIIVEEILRNDELSRKDDCYLILQVIRRLYPYDVGKKFETVMFNAKNKGISFESITRVRRKLQEKNPELKDEETVKKRNIIQNEYIKYSKQN
jgi:hypothetical protein